MAKQSNFNKWFRAQLEKSYSSLFSSIEELESNGLSYILGTIDHTDPRRIIRVSNCRGEITVAIDTHHTHCECRSEADCEGGFSEAMEWITKVRKGLVFICTIFEGDKLSSTLSTYNLDDLIIKENQRAEVLCYPEAGVREFI